MTVEERRGSIGEDGPKDNFPVGMRVLAVDDDLTCLRVLETLLRRCEYNVITTNQAVLALKMLRENKNKFDLVISDVHMPDMDGFKLLEHVGLEMDLPVIMLSGNSDPKLVMKGITHGACDYLLKPVRIEELKNIWQHVIRRRKFDSKDPNNSDNADKPHQGTGEGGQGSGVAGHADRNGKLNRKRKDQNEDEDEEFEENEEENEDTSTQKKPRVVWSVELHRKFVAAVNQLGIDKAVPKKILDLMSVERLTRENVASHLQKYRLYLKRISCVASQQVNMAAALGGKDPSYFRMGSLDGLGDFHALTASGQLSNPSLASFPPAGILGRLNTSAALSMRGVASSGMIQLGCTQNSGSSISDLGKLQQVIPPVNQNGSLVKGMPTSFELDQLQQNKCVSRIGEFSTPIDDPTFFPLASAFPDTGVTIGSSSNSFLNVSNNQLVLQGHPQQARSQGGLGNQSSVRMSSLNSESFEIGAGVSSHLPDQGRCNENWQSATPLTDFTSNPLPLSDPFNQAEFSPSNLRENISSISPNIRSNSLDASPTSMVTSSLQDLRRDTQYQAGAIGVNGQHDNLRVLNYGSMGGRVGQNMNYTMGQKREEHKQDYTHNSNLSFCSSNSSAPVHSVVGPLGQKLGQNNAVSSRKMDSTMISQTNSGTPFLMHQNGLEKSAMGRTNRLKEEYHLEQTKSQGGFLPNNCGSLEDLMNAMIKQEQEEVMFMSEDIDCDIYPVRTCI